MTNPWRQVRDLNVEVRWQELDNRLGECDSVARVIVLDPRQDQVERRCTLAHELVHMERGDTCLLGTYPDGDRQDARQEASVAREAARRLLPIRQLAQAFAVHGEDLVAVADEVWVDEATLVARLDGLHPTERELIRRRLDEREDAA